MTTSDGYICFSRENFSDITDLFKSFTAPREGLKKIKLCEKGHHAHLGENGHVFLFNCLELYDSRPPCCETELSRYC